jgi:hypothetical protein
MGKEKNARTVSAQSRRHAGGQGTNLPLAEIVYIEVDTESLIVAAQDQALGTNYFKRRVLKKETETKCRLCKKYEENIDHLTSVCPVLAKDEYTYKT